MMESNNLSKSDWRRMIRARLAKLTTEEYQEAATAIFKRFFELEPVQNAHKIMLYYSVRQEVSTRELLTQLLSSGKTVSLPICTPDGTLKAGITKNIQELVPAKYGLLEPNPEAPLLDPGSLDLVVLPGLAFDNFGNRLGQGKGYYDRFLKLATHAFRLGLAYRFQLVTKLPITAVDLPVDGLLTPDGYCEFASQIRK